MADFGSAAGTNTGTAGTIYTIGHSTRTQAELEQILDQAEIRLVVDVRTAPGSRRHPQFNREALAAWLPADGIAYVHEPGLGGFRRGDPDSENTGWTHPSFRAYADYMRSDAFQQALARLSESARERRTCFMCSEAQWWRCHRRLISDALTVKGWRVLHLGLGSKPARHELTAFAVVEGGVLRYPAPNGPDVADA